MAKNNIRSIRFSDDIRDAIDAQPGSSFNEKFETLVARCHLEIPEKEKQLESLNDKISQKREEFYRLSTLANKLEQKLSRLAGELEAVSELTEQIAKDMWESEL